MARRPVPPPHGWGRRLLWLLGIWVTSVATLGLFALLMRLLMRSVGMST